MRSTWPLASRDDAAVARRVVDVGGEEGRGGVGEAVLGREHGEGLRAQERRVAEHDDDVVLAVEHVAERGEADRDRVARAALDGLLDELDRHVGDELLLDGLGDVLGAVSDDDHDPVERQRREHVEGVQHHRPPAQRVQHLGRVGAHALALTRRGHDGRERASVLTRHGLPRLLVVVVLVARAEVARGRGLEPRLGTPKDPVLPLHHPRSRVRRYPPASSRLCPCNARRLACAPPWAR